MNNTFFSLKREDSFGVIVIFVRELANEIHVKRYDEVKRLLYSDFVLFYFSLQTMSLSCVSL